VESSILQAMRYKEVVYTDFELFKEWVNEKFHNS